MMIFYFLILSLFTYFFSSRASEQISPKIGATPLNTTAVEADYVLKNGKIVDGTGNSWYYGDVAVQGNRIIAIGTSLNLPAKIIIDVKKKVIAPGFIDVHTHIEGDEKARTKAENFIYDGVT